MEGEEEEVEEGRVLSAAAVESEEIELDWSSSTGRVLGTGKDGNS